MTTSNSDLIARARSRVTRIAFHPANPLLSDFADALEAADKRIAELEARPSIPPGFKLVPVEPSDLWWTSVLTRFARNLICNCVKDGNEDRPSPCRCHLVIQDNRVRVKEHCGMACSFVAEEPKLYSAMLNAANNWHTAMLAAAPEPPK